MQPLKRILPPLSPLSLRLPLIPFIPSRVDSARLLNTLALLGPLSTTGSPSRLDCQSPVLLPVSDISPIPLRLFEPVAIRLWLELIAFFRASRPERPSLALVLRMTHQNERVQNSVKIGRNESCMSIEQ